jgi:hypothetical protein
MAKGKYGYYGVTKGIQIGVFYDLWYVVYHHFTQLPLTRPRENVAKISKDVGGDWFKGDNRVQAIRRYDEEDNKRIIQWD